MCSHEVENSKGSGAGTLSIYKYLCNAHRLEWDDEEYERVMQIPASRFRNCTFSQLKEQQQQ